MERHSLILLLAFACSSILILFENIQDVSLYNTRNVKDVNTTDIPKPRIIYNETTFEIALSRSPNNLLTIPIQFSPQKPIYNMILDSTNNNENYYYDILIPCCNSKYASKDTCLSQCPITIDCNELDSDCSKIIIIQENEEKIFFSFKALQLKNQTVGFIGNSFTNQTLDMVYSDHEFWKGTDGSFGFAFSKSDSSFQRYLSIEYPSQKFALDINKNSSKLILGNKLNEYNVIWSEPQMKISEWYYKTVPNGFEHQFTIYNFSICNHFLLSNYSFTWEGRINTIIQGLRVPNEFYYNIMSWLNTTNIDENTILPSLKFSLGNKGQELIIPLSSLYDKKEKKLLLSPNGNIRYYYYQGGLMYFEPKIEFGLLVLEQFTTFFNMKEKRIGFVQKEVKDSLEYCLPVENCRGDQVYYQGSNKCIDPICPLFKSVDHSSKTCSFKVEFYVIFSFIFGMLMIYELIVYFLYQRVSANLYQ